MNIKYWLNTRTKYIEWLSKCDLRKIFADKIKYESLSFWWLTTLMDKDNINDQLWYEDLNRKLNNFEIKNNYHINYFILFIGIIKQFLSKILSLIFIKLFFSDKYDHNVYKKNCFFSLFTNLIYHKNNCIDRQYGKLTISNNTKKIYAIEIPENLYLIKNLSFIRSKLKDIPVDFFIVNKNLSFFDIIKIYYHCLISLFRLTKILKKRNFFIINNCDCSQILKNKLISSFFGHIQNQLMKGLALKKTLNKMNLDNFINCYDFHPQARVFYYFSKNSKARKIININHANFSENNLFFSYLSEDFSKKYSSSFSPMPDYYFCQGEKYLERLKNIFDTDKLFCIGSLKSELNKFEYENFNTKLISNSKKTLSILCSINDYKSIISILNKCEKEEFEIYVFPHPLKKDETITYFKDNLNFDFINGTGLDKVRIFNNSHGIIFGDTSLGLELAIKNYRMIRLYDEKFIPTFDIDDEIPTATNKEDFLGILNKINIPQKCEEIEKKYFFKYDKNSSSRFESILKTL